MTGLIEFVSDHSLDDLRAERERWREITEEKKKAAELADEEAVRASSTYRFIDSAVKMREAQESQNGHKPVKLVFTKTASKAPESAEQDKTAIALEILRQSHGMKPGELYKTLLARNITISRPYVSTILMRLKGREQVIEENGKYYAK